MHNIFQVSNYSHFLQFLDVTYCLLIEVYTLPSASSFPLSKHTGIAKVLVYFQTLKVDKQSLPQTITRLQIFCLQKMLEAKIRHTNRHSKGFWQNITRKQATFH